MPFRCTRQCSSERARLVSPNQVAAVRTTIRNAHVAMWVMMDTVHVCMLWCHSTGASHEVMTGDDLQQTLPLHSSIRNGTSIKATQQFNSTDVEIPLFSIFTICNLQKVPAPRFLQI